MKHLIGPRGCQQSRVTPLLPVDAHLLIKSSLGAQQLDCVRLGLTAITHIHTRVVETSNPGWKSSCFHGCSLYPFIRLMCNPMSCLLTRYPNAGTPCDAVIALPHSSVHSLFSPPRPFAGRRRISVAACCKVEAGTTLGRIPRAWSTLQRSQAHELLRTYLLLDTAPLPRLQPNCT